MRDVDDRSVLEQRCFVEVEDERKKLLPFFDEAWDMLPNLLLECDSISSKLQNYKKTFQGTFIEFNTKRVEVHEHVNAYHLFRAFPKIERKANLLLEHNEYVSTFSIQKVNAIIRERSITRDRQSVPALYSPKKRVPKSETDKSPSELIRECQDVVMQGNELLEILEFISKEDSMLVSLINAVNSGDYYTIASRLKSTKWKDEIIPIWSRLKPKRSMTR